MTFDKWLFLAHKMTIHDLFLLSNDEIEKYELEYKEFMRWN